MKISSVKMVAVILALTGWDIGRLPVAAQQVQHQTITVPGGIPGLPMIESITSVSNGYQFTWAGPSGYYQVFQKSNSLTAPWIALSKATNLANTATITKLYNSAFFRVSGPSPKYGGYQLCFECHNNICQYETNTAHANAFSSAQFKALGGQNNSSCLPCHTVGYGLPTGFVSAAATPNLANVQCENCHGPAANHAANPDDPTVIPRADIAATVCGGCHSENHSTFTTAPTFAEWSSSGHAVVVPDALQSMSTSTNSIRTCGVCHSGTARIAMIGGHDPAVTLTKDYNVPQTCAVCHDPHQTNGVADQLRNPTWSTNFFALTSADTATATAFTNKYQANLGINVCAQCHNDRGAAWTDTSRAPHHSAQYNFLLGSVGELLGGPATFNPGAHAGLPSSANNSISGTFFLENQCASCHMQSDSADADNHTFTVASQNVCYNCHVTPPQMLEDFFLTPAISNGVSTLITAMNTWAARQTNALLTATNVVAWEYTTPGGLTWQTNSSGLVTSWSQDNSVTFAGPVAAGQALIPDQIKRARFNMYLVLNDGSFGVHNPTLALNLLNAAEIWMEQVLQ